MRQDEIEKERLKGQSATPARAAAKKAYSRIPSIEVGDGHLEADFELE